MNQMCVGPVFVLSPRFHVSQHLYFHLAVWGHSNGNLRVNPNLLPSRWQKGRKENSQRSWRNPNVTERERGRGRSAPKMGICQIKGSWGCWHSHWSAELSYLIQSPFILPLVSAHHRLSVFSPHGKLFCICRTDNCDNTSWCSTTLPNLMWLVHLQAPPNINYFKRHFENSVYGGHDGDGEEKDNQELLLLREKTFWLRCLLS